MFRSDDDVLCPVIAWSKVVKRVRRIDGSSNMSEVCLFNDGRKNPTLITAEQARLKLRAVVNLIGQETLGFLKDDVGLHSIRSGGAMAMFLSGTSVIVIQRVGRWSSEAFLEYIREQVETFTLDVSRNIIQYEHFFDLNAGNRDAATHQPLGNIADDDIEKEDGPDSVPFCIKFNDLTLHGKGME